MLTEVTVLIRFSFILSLLLLFSCGPDEILLVELQASGTTTNCDSLEPGLSMEVIIDDLDWSDYLDLQNAREKRNSKSTGQIKIPTINASCTAFLVNENTIMTNNHCVPNQLYAEGVRLFLRDDNQMRETFFCEKLLTTSSTLDFSLLECDGFPGRKYGYIPLGLSVPAKNQDMYVVQENCDYLSDPRCLVHKFLAKGKIRKVGLNSLSHDADTLGGSSGSPIFYQGTHELIGIHHAGMSKSGSNSSMNFGVPMHRIAKYLFDHHSEIKVYRSVASENQVDDLIENCD